MADPKEILGKTDIEKVFAVARRMARFEPMVNAKTFIEFIRDASAMELQEFIDAFGGVSEMIEHLTTHSMELDDKMTDVAIALAEASRQADLDVMVNAKTFLNFADVSSDAEIQDLIDDHGGIAAMIEHLGEPSMEIASGFMTKSARKRDLPEGDADEPEGRGAKYDIVKFIGEDGLNLRLNFPSKRFNETVIPISDELAEFISGRGSKRPKDLQSTAVLALMGMMRDGKLDRDDDKKVSDLTPELMNILKAEADIKGFGVINNVGKKIAQALQSSRTGLKPLKKEFDLHDLLGLLAKDVLFTPASKGGALLGRFEKKPKTIQQRVQESFRRKREAEERKEKLGGLSKVDRPKFHPRGLDPCSEKASRMKFSSRSGRDLWLSECRERSLKNRGINGGKIVRDDFDGEVGIGGGYTGRDFNSVNIQHDEVGVGN